MALKGSETFTLAKNSSGKKVNLIVDWVVTSQDTKFGSSTLDFTAKIQSEVAFGFSNKSTFLIRYKAYHQSIRQTIMDDAIGAVYIAADSTYTLGSAVGVVISHDEGGKAKFELDGNVNFGVGIVSIEGSGASERKYFESSKYHEIDSFVVAAEITSAPVEFTDEEIPSIQYSNPSGSVVDGLQVCIAAQGSDGGWHPTIADYRDVPKTTTGSYTFNLTDTERANLRRAVTWGNTATIRFYIKTIIGDENKYNNKSSTLTLVNHAPTLAPEIKDVGSESVLLTGNPLKVIKYFNVMSINMRAEAKKTATLISQVVNCGGQTLSSDAPESLSGFLSYVESNVFACSIQDSRGARDLRNIYLGFVNYFKPTCSFDLKAPTTDGDMLFTASGTFFNDYFGDEGVAKHNELTIRYRIKLNSDGFGDWVTIPAEDIEINGNEYSLSYTVTGLNYRNAHTLELMVSDLIPRYQVTRSKKVKTMPIYDWSSEDFRFNVNVNFPHASVEDQEVGIYGTRADGSITKAMVPCNKDGALTLGEGGFEEGVGATKLMGNDIRIQAAKDIIILKTNALGEETEIFKTDEYDGISIGAGSFAQQSGITGIWGNEIVARSHGAIDIESADAVRLSGSSVKINGKEYGKNQVLWEDAYWMIASQTVALSSPISAQPHGIVLVFSGYNDSAAQNYNYSTFFIPKEAVALNPDGGYSFMMTGLKFTPFAYKYLYINDTNIKGHADNEATGTSNGIAYNNKGFVLRYVIGV